ncbi:hypothetical protein ACFV7Q_32895 [Streptomyces sp. NPDC059851]|uniref:hypothetical protein n=1 Tax=Streptomyces sp. NPDC059851 TaxID=3346971 RepID=UPI00364BB5F3
MDAVLETYVAADFALWPVADAPADRLLALSGQLSPREVGTAMAILTDYDEGHDDSGAHAAAHSAERVRRLLTVERVVAPGGLRIRDTATGVTAPPGCCFGIENWRDWLDLMNGEMPWLGHSPAPRVEHVGEGVRLWPDADRPEGLPIDIPRAQLPALLGSVQNELAGFLTSVEQWAAQYVPALAPAVVAKLDEDLVITAPLSEC